jgi:hypothetical protein
MVVSVRDTYSDQEGFLPSIVYKHFDNVVPGPEWVRAKYNQIPGDLVL